MSHHGYNPFDDHKGEILRRLFEAQDKLPKFPHGRLNKNDEGSLAFSIGTEDGKVVIHFAEPTAWLGMTSDQAAELGSLLIKHARSIGLTKPLTVQL